MKSRASQRLIIREYSCTELLDFAKTFEITKENENLWKLCEACYKQLTGKNLIDEID